jgi:hypothetical protein
MAASFNPFEEQFSQSLREGEAKNNAEQRNMSPTSESTPSMPGQSLPHCDSNNANTDTQLDLAGFRNPQSPVSSYNTAMNMAWYNPLGPTVFRRQGKALCGNQYETTNTFLYTDSGQQPAFGCTEMSDYNTNRYRQGIRTNASPGLNYCTQGPYPCGNLEGVSSQQQMDSLQGLKRESSLQVQSPEKIGVNTLGTCGQLLNPALQYGTTGMEPPSLDIKAQESLGLKYKPTKRLRGIGAQRYSLGLLPMTLAYQRRISLSSRW